MTVAATIDMLREARVYNAHNLSTTARNLGQSDVHVEYTSVDRGRGGFSARWRVYRPGYQTDPDAWWGDYGNKSFLVLGRADKEPKRLAATEWASGRYGVTDWVRDPFGAYRSQQALDAVLAWAREQAGRA